MNEEQSQDGLACTFRLIAILLATGGVIYALWLVIQEWQQQDFDAAYGAMVMVAGGSLMLTGMVLQTLGVFDSE